MLPLSLALRRLVLGTVSLEAELLQERGRREEARGGAGARKESRSEVDQPGRRGEYRDGRGNRRPSYNRGDGGARC